MNQCKMILQHLEKFGSITDIEAIEKYGVHRLSARIFDLRGKGHGISTEMEIGKNRYGERMVYARYRLERAQNV